MKALNTAGTVLGIGLILAAGILAGNAPAQADALTERTALHGTVARGMSGAYITQQAELGGIAYNPASTAQIRNSQYRTDLNREPFGDLDVDNIGLTGAQRWGSFVHGLGVHRTEIEFDFADHFEFTTPGLGLDFTDDIFYYNLGFQISPDVSFGGNLKYLQVSSSAQMRDEDENNIGDGDATGYGLDLGVIWTIDETFTFGASLRDLIGERDWDTGQTDEIPLELQTSLRMDYLEYASAEFTAVYNEEPGIRSFGAATEVWVIDQRRDVERRTRSIEERRREEGTERRRRIFEQRQSPENFSLAFRTGIEAEQIGEQDVNFSVGTSFRFNRVQFDYSFQDHSTFDGTHFFGLSYRQ